MDGRFLAVHFFYLLNRTNVLCGRIGVKYERERNMAKNE